MYDNELKQKERNYLNQIQPQLLIIFLLFFNN